MVALITKDGNNRNRSLSINGFVKSSGTKVASVTNDHNELYFVQVRTNGTTTCKHENGEQCLGHKFTGHCYHVDAVTSADLPTFADLNRPTPLASRVGVVSQQEAITIIADYDKEEDMYAQLSPSAICQGCCKAYRPEHSDQTFCRRCC